MTGQPLPTTLGQLLAELTFAPELRDVDPATPVRAVTLDSRRATAGTLFAALPGARAHGATFAGQAIAAGACAVLTDPAGLEHLPAQAPALVVPDVRAALGEVSACLLGQPAQALTTFGVTGTNGKTTTTFLLDHVLRSMGWRTGLIGTVENRVGDVALASTLTTPESPDLQGWLAQMRDADVDMLSMEVSSHALALRRVDGVTFDVVGFTNLSQDHLDFHGDLEGYFGTKADLFTSARARRGVVVIDDPWGRRLATEAQIPVATLSTTGEDADWVVSEVAPGVVGSAFLLSHRDGRTVRTSVTLPGPFNVANAALALAMVLEGGADVRDLVAALGDGIDARVPGRMEVVATAPRVVVDFAHNAEALELALTALRATTPGRLIVVFGATGDRDAGKRPVMGRVAATHADVAVVTDDDPHGEDPAAVRREVLAGTTGIDDARATVHEVAPRQDAIARAVAMAGPEDTVLVAGRGHETIQEVAGVDLPLDDRVVARSAAARWHDDHAAAVATSPEHEEP